MSLDIPGHCKEKYSEEELQAELMKLVAGYKDEIDKNVLVCFERREELLFSIKAYLLSAPTLNISAEEEWLKYVNTESRRTAEEGAQLDLTTSSGFNVEVKLKKSRNKEAATK